MDRSNIAKWAGFGALLGVCLAAFRDASIWGANGGPTSAAIGELVGAAVIGAIVLGLIFVVVNRARR